jgi:putative Mg2+ transporter-C (MgtC) family protein
VLIGRSIAGDSADALSRIIQGLITGIGFVGGGAIVKSTEEVKGTSTAAAIWATGAIGAAAAWGRVGLAAALAIITYLTFLLLTPVRAMIKQEEEQGGSGE